MQVPLVDLKAQYQSIREETQQAISAVLDGMELLLGPNVRAFEQEFARYCGVEHAVGVGSGTEALYLALRTCGVRPADEVITVGNTFWATAEAIVQCGAVPVLVDVDPDTYTLDPGRLEQAITSRTRAVIPVHLYGQMADMAAISAIAQSHGLAVIEDACQAHGAESNGRRAGSCGDAAAFSFYFSKNLGAFGEAGAVTTGSAALAEQLREFRDHGSIRKYEHRTMGGNSRLDELQAAVLRIKLRSLERWNELRRQHAEAYGELLQDVDVELPIVRAGARHVFHLYVVRVRDGRRDTVREALSADGIATGIHYPIPIHWQAGAQQVVRVAGGLPVTETFASQILSLPMYPELQSEQLGHVATSLRAQAPAKLRAGL